MLIRARRWIAPALLVAVAATQMVMAHTHQLNPWTGGGFGMFATLDRLRTRVVQVWSEDGAPLPLPPAVRWEAHRARTLPTPTRLKALARATAAAVDQPVRVVLMRVRFDADRVRLEPVAEASAP